MKRKWLEDLDGWKSLDYVRLKGVPVRRSTQGYLLDIKEEALERMIARAIIENGIPFFGAEVQFLRRVLGVSLNEFGRRLNLTAGAVFNWERKPEARLLVVNEVAVRALCAEELGVPISGWLSALAGKDRKELEIVVSVPKKSKRREQQAAAKNGPVKLASASRSDFVPAWVARQRARRAKAANGKSAPTDLSGRDSS